jgi:hypothetical protein
MASCAATPVSRSVGGEVSVTRMQMRKETNLDQRQVELVDVCFFSAQGCFVRRDFDSDANDKIAYT